MSTGPQQLEFTAQQTIGASVGHTSGLDNVQFSAPAGVLGAAFLFASTPHPLGEHARIHDALILQDPKWPSKPNPRYQDPAGIQFFDMLMSRDPAVTREAVDSVNSFTRQSLREQDFYRRLMPPRLLDTVIQHEQQHMMGIDLARNPSVSMAAFYDVNLGVIFEPPAPPQSVIHRPETLFNHQRRSASGLTHTLRLLNTTQQHQRADRVVSALAAFRQHFREHRSFGVSTNFASAFEHLLLSGQFDEVCEIYCMSGFNVQGRDNEGRLLLGTCQITSPLDTEQLPQRWRYDLVDLLNRVSFRDWPEPLVAVARSVSERIARYARAGIPSCCCGDMPTEDEITDRLSGPRQREMYMLEFFAYEQLGQYRPYYAGPEARPRYMAADAEGRNIGMPVPDVE